MDTRSEFIEGDGLLEFGRQAVLLREGKLYSINVLDDRHFEFRYEMHTVSDWRALLPTGGVHAELARVYYW